MFSFYPNALYSDDIMFQFNLIAVGLKGNCRINITTSEETVKSANYIAICNLVWKNEAVAEELCGRNQMFVCMGTESRMVPKEDNICLLYMGLFDLCLVQMARHAS